MFRPNRDSTNPDAGLSRRMFSWSISFARRMPGWRSASRTIYTLMPNLHLRLLRRYLVIRHMAVEPVPETVYPRYELTAHEEIIFNRLLQHKRCV